MCEHVFVDRDERSILHADLDSFYASVEQRDDPSLRGRPVAVGGGGVILAASYEAKRFGVRTADAGVRGQPALPRSGRRLGRDSRRTRQPARQCSRSSTTPRRWSRASRSTRRSSTCRWPPAPLRHAGRDRRRTPPPTLRDDVGLPITVGVARTKFLAKVASGVGKPDGLLVVEPDGELDFLHPLPVEKLWGVGAVTAAKLESPWDVHRRATSPAWTRRAERDRRRGAGSATLVALAQRRRPAGRDRQATRLDRIAAGARASTRAPDEDRGDPAADHRPDHPADAPCRAASVAP